MFSSDTVFTMGTDSVFIDELMVVDLGIERCNLYIPRSPDLLAMEYEGLNHSLEVNTGKYTMETPHNYIQHLGSRRKSSVKLGWMYFIRSWA